MRTIVGATFAALILLGACGGDDDDAASDDEAQTYIDAIAAEMQDEEDGMALDEPTATCFATESVDAIGVDNLKDADVTPEELADAENLGSLDIEIPDDAADKMAEGLKDCDAVGVLRDLFVTQITADLAVEVSDDDRACLEAGLEDDAVADAVANTFMNGESEEFSGLLLAAVGDCPAVAKGVLLAEAPADLSPEARTCVETYVDDNEEAVAEAFGAGTDEGMRSLFDDLTAACPQAFPE